jgi:anti-anti-sigma regulatory factor
MDQPLAVRAEHQRGHTIVTVAGDIDSTTAPQLRECLHKLAACGRPLVVDMDAVTFLGAAGLRVLATAASRAALPDTAQPHRGRSPRRAAARKGHVRGGSRSDRWR